MRDQLPHQVHNNESGIINLDSEEGPGTHWTAYKKNGKEAVYFDSYGNLKPPRKLINYLNTNGLCKILYNNEQLQLFNSFNCGHLCLKFLYN